jgi:hypothetical protein
MELSNFKMQWVVVRSCRGNVLANASPLWGRASAAGWLGWLAQKRNMPSVTLAMAFQPIINQSTDYRVHLFFYGVRTPYHHAWRVESS